MMADALIARQAELHRRIAQLPASLSNRIATDDIQVTGKMIDFAIETLSRHWAAFDERHEQLLLLEGIDQKPYIKDDFYGEAEIVYLTALNELEHLRPAPPQGTADAHPSATINLNETLPPLPKPPLPEFSGAYLDWEPFRDAFEGMVINRTDISDVQRLMFLKRALKGDAALLVRNIQTTAANFQGAWEAVCRRYSNPRLLVSAHLTSLFNLAPARHDSAAEMRALLDRSTEELRALSQMGRPVQHWDDLIIFLLLSRLDSTSREEWQLHLTTTDSQKKTVDPAYVPTHPTLAELQSFLESRIRAKEMTFASSTAGSSPSTKFASPRTARVHQATTKSPTKGCKICSKDHPHFQCPVLRQKDPAGRLEEVKKLKLCFNCLGMHNRSECKSSKLCQSCKKGHNSFLQCDEPIFGAAS